MREDLTQRRKALMARLKDLTQRMSTIDAQLDTPKTRDWEDRAIESEGDEVLEGLGHASEAEVALIRAALARMDRGEYGLCTSCGEAISSDRLDVLPFTPLCRICATERG
ncbi:TraR/DksA C4-type zinc finger protein [Rhodobacteraceae bacterium N5(2021)]|uniref:TraR/DksA C4-type zinc finger protein n=1 Tax=Gymnodinialimonas phycosphaerae TaxID=2841589 RepID=A0A975YH74_9RHOB|nr:TraR/DksA C4-type zinc finger protein [Gymnodinialimonas phycosphaerae]MBY4892482.1 TraR/DksA C4-type zinc finger protein [Gymnodinialimonas phycosphaerae]